jgi:hypothetical protein
MMMMMRRAAMESKKAIDRAEKGDNLIITKCDVRNEKEMNARRKAIK